MAPLSSVKMDLRNGYLQVPLAQNNMDLTAFVMHVGVFRLAHGIWVLISPELLSEDNVTRTGRHPAPSTTLHTTPGAVLSVFRTAWGTLNAVRG